MISTGILQLMWSIAEPIVNRMPEVAINYDGIANSTVYQFLKAGLYMLPMQTVAQILGIVLYLWVIRTIIAFLHSLWSALPIL